MKLPEITEKPWGNETLWACTEHYVGKLLTVYSGEELSVQYHNHKDETMFVLTGQGIIKFYTMEGDKPVLSAIHSVRVGDSVHIPPKQIHSVEAITDMEILEASTNHLDDLVRVRDRYGRG